MFSEAKQIGFGFEMKYCWFGSVAAVSCQKSKSSEELSQQGKCLGRNGVGNGERKCLNVVRCFLGERLNKVRYINVLELKGRGCAEAFQWEIKSIEILI